MTSLFVAIQFLTIIPVRLSKTVDSGLLVRSTTFFPVAGALQGLLLVVAAPLLLKILPLSVTAALLVVLLVLANGGFHLDGLADTFDGISVKSTGNRDKDSERRLAAMKDSTTGALGVVALVLALLLKYSLIGALLSRPLLAPSLLCLFLVPVFSRWSAVCALFHGRPARPEGLGSIFIGRTTAVFVGGASLWLVLIYVAAAFVARVSIAQLMPALLPAVLAGVLYLCVLIWNSFCNRRFGGMTGDTLGAAIELADLVCLLLLSLLYPFIFQGGQTL